jgi:hypothetical protein
LYFQGIKREYGNGIASSNGGYNHNKTTTEDKYFGWSGQAGIASVGSFGDTAVAR